MSENDYDISRQMIEMQYFSSNEWNDRGNEFNKEEGAKFHMYSFVKWIVLELQLR